MSTALRNFEDLRNLVGREEVGTRNPWVPFRQNLTNKLGFLKVKVGFNYFTMEIQLEKVVKQVESASLSASLNNEVRKQLYTKLELALLDAEGTATIDSDGTVLNVDRNYCNCLKG